MPSTSEQTCADSVGKQMTISIPSTISLRSLPAEILIQILTNLLEPELLNLKKTSHFFRDFIHAGAPIIANTIITRDLSIAAQLFNPVLKNGWLTPTHPIILAEEIHIARYMLDRMKHSIEDTAFLHTRPLLTTRLSTPGPAFLKFLRSGRCRNLWVEASLREEIDGRITLSEERSAKRLGSYYVRPFLDEMNTANVFVQRGYRSRKNSYLTPIAV